MAIAVSLSMTRSFRLSGRRCVDVGVRPLPDGPRVACPAVQFRALRSDWLLFSFADFVRGLFGGFWREDWRIFGLKEVFGAADRVGFSRFRGRAAVAEGDLVGTRSGFPPDSELPVAISPRPSVAVARAKLRFSLDFGRCRH